MAHTDRKIIHIDMDAFFASVEQRDNPDLRGKPVAVGYDGPRGVVATASYEARRFGVHSAMAMATAKRLCPQLTVVDSDYSRYKEVSAQVHDIFQEYTDLIEPISIDEAFLDVTRNKPGILLAQDIAEEIRGKIREQLRLTASAGVSYNKLLAKIASDYHKPDGMFVIHPDRALGFIDSLPVEDFWGVGPKTSHKMHHMGIFNGEQLRECPLQRLTTEFGKMGQTYYNFARGIDPRPVEPVRIRKSVGCEQTFAEDTGVRSTLIIELYHTVLELVERIQKAGFSGRTLTLKVKFADFSQITRSITRNANLTSKAQILPLAKQLLRDAVMPTSQPVRLLGLAVSNPPTDDIGRPVWVEGELEFEE